MNISKDTLRMVDYDHFFSLDINAQIVGHGWNFLHGRYLIYIIEHRVVLGIPSNYKYHDIDSLIKIWEHMVYIHSISFKPEYLQLQVVRPLSPEKKASNDQSSGSGSGPGNCPIPRLKISMIILLKISWENGRNDDFAYFGQFSKFNQ